MEGQPPKAAPEIQRVIDFLNGRWNMKLTYAPSPLLPAGGEATGEETTSAGPGGFSVVIDTTATGPGDFLVTAKGFILWDGAKDVYRLYWFSSLSPAASLFTGTWEGEDLSFVGTETIMGQTMSSRHRLSNIKSDSFDYAIDMGPTPDKLKRVITIQYTKAT